MVLLDGVLKVLLRRFKLSTQSFEQGVSSASRYRLYSSYISYVT